MCFFQIIRRRLTLITPTLYSTKRLASTDENNKREVGTTRPNVTLRWTCFTVYRFSLWRSLVGRNKRLQYAAFALPSPNRAVNIEMNTMRNVSDHISFFVGVSLVLDAYNHDADDSNSSPYTNPRHVRNRLHGPRTIRFAVHTKSVLHSGDSRTSVINITLSAVSEPSTRMHRR